ncbi:hypothetical protein ACIP93_24970 [Streptomyces sp. NPDC088745]|uniref:hypothetical protein n=1 Tax=Streptomyces sp. NPDC088745 TaxID=3365884 RepID=UPI0037F9BF77
MKPEEFVEARQQPAQGTWTPSGPPVRAPRSPRRRSLRTLVVAGVVGAGIAVGVTVALSTHGDSPGTRPAPDLGSLDVVARPDQSPPRERIAAGKVAVSAYSTSKVVKQPGGNGVLALEWHLLNSSSNRYERTDWAYLDVARGLKTAAVLERGLPVNRVGLLDLASGKVQRWIKVDRSVGGVQFSPDGKRLVATAYSLNPDGLFKDAPQQVNGEKLPGPKPSRTGFYVIDVATGRAEFTSSPSKKDERGFIDGGRQDFRWSRDGKLLWTPWRNESGKLYVDTDGRETQAPKHEARPGQAEAGLSPDGRRVAGTMPDDEEGIVSEVLDTKTGERAALVPGQQLLAWADDRHLVAWRCDPAQCAPGKGEFRNQLVLVGLDSDTVTPLSGFREPSLRYDGRWTPVLTER